MVGFKGFSSLLVILFTGMFYFPRICLKIIQGLGIVNFGFLFWDLMRYQPGLKGGHLGFRVQRIGQRVLMFSSRFWV